MSEKLRAGKIGIAYEVEQKLEHVIANEYRRIQGLGSRPQLKCLIYEEQIMIYPVFNYDGRTVPGSVLDHFPKC